MHDFCNFPLRNKIHRLSAFMCVPADDTLLSCHGTCFRAPAKQLLLIEEPSYVTLHHGKAGSRHARHTKTMHLLSFPFAWKLIHLCNCSSLGSLPQRRFWVAVVTDEAVFSLAPGGRPVAHRGVLGIQRLSGFSCAGPWCCHSQTLQPVTTLGPIQSIS